MKFIFCVFRGIINNYQKKKLFDRYSLRLNFIKILPGEGKFYNCRKNVYFKTNFINILNE